MARSGKTRGWLGGRAWQSLRAGLAAHGEWVKRFEKFAKLK